MAGEEGVSLYLAAENKAVNPTSPVPIAKPDKGPKCFPYRNLCEVSIDSIQMEPHMRIWDKVTQTTCLEGKQGKRGSLRSRI